MTKLYPFQQQGVEAFQQLGGRCLCADDPGLGKTVQALAWWKRHLGDGPVVVVCQATIKEQWRREALTHTGVRAAVLWGKSPPRHGLPPSRPAFYIVNYDILGKVQAAGTKKKSRTWGNLLKAVRPKLVILDECQALISHDSLRTRRVKALCHGVPHVLALAGTGAMNSKVIQMWPTLNIVRPDLYPNRHAFGLEFCGAEKVLGRWAYNGSDNEGRLHRKLAAHVMVRRRAVDVLPELPKVIRTVVPLRLPKAAFAEYRAAWDDFAKWIRTAHADKARKALKAEELSRWGYVKRLCGRLKIELASEWVRDFLAGGQKLILFGLHKAVLGEFAAAFGTRAVVVTGSVTGPARQRAIDAFNHDNRVRLMVGNVDAAGVGWSCTGGSAVAFCELAQTPGQHAQAERRVSGVRRGLPGVPATAHYLVAADTIEERICDVLQKRMRVLGKVLDGGAAGDFDLYDAVRRAVLKGK